MTELNEIPDNIDTIPVSCETADNIKGFGIALVSISIIGTIILVLIAVPKLDIGLFFSALSLLLFGLFSVYLCNAIATHLINAKKQTCLHLKILKRLEK